MRSRRRNWMLKRIALAFAVAVVVAPTAQAVPLEPGATKPDQQNVVRDSNSFPRGNTAPHGTAVQAGDYGMPRAMPTDYALARGDGVELARVEGRGPGTDIRSLDRVENVRVEPRGIERPILVADKSSLDWGDAGLGAGLSFAAILLAAAAALSVRQHNRLGQV